jgi:CheY-like chemotaxis protein
VLADREYRVLSAANGPEALSLAATAETIDLLLTDIRMPGMDGIELYERMRRLRRGLKVLFISGYAQGKSLDQPFLAKPFKSAALLRKVDEVLAGPQTGAG